MNIINHSVFLSHRSLIFCTSGGSDLNELCFLRLLLCAHFRVQSVMLPFTYVCFWKCCTSIKVLFFLFTKFHNTKLRTVPCGTVRKVRLVRIFITRTNVPYPYLCNNYVPYKRTVLYAKKWSVPYRTCVPYRTILPSLAMSHDRGFI